MKTPLDVIAMLGLAAVALFGPPPATAQAGSGGGMPAVGVQPGDQVIINVYTGSGAFLDEVAGERIVDQNGALFLPYVGSMFVRGLTSSEIRELLTERYGSFYENPVVDVRTKFRVNVTGAVRSPGNYLVDPTTTIVDVVSLAGGLGTSVSMGMVGGAADASRVHLFRGGRSTLLDLRAESADPQLLKMNVASGDWIWVPAEPMSVWRENVTLVGSVLGIAASVVWIATVVNN